VDAHKGQISETGSLLIKTSLVTGEDAVKELCSTRVTSVREKKSHTYESYECQGEEKSDLAHPLFLTYER